MNNLTRSVIKERQEVANEGAYPPGFLKFIFWDLLRVLVVSLAVSGDIWGLPSLPAPGPLENFLRTDMIIFLLKELITN